MPEGMYVHHVHAKAKEAKEAKGDILQISLK